VGPLLKVSDGRDARPRTGIRGSSALLKTITCLAFASVSHHSRPRSAPSTRILAGAEHGPASGRRGRKGYAIRPQ